MRSPGAPLPTHCCLSRLVHVPSLTRSLLVHPARCSQCVRAPRGSTLASPHARAGGASSAFPRAMRSRPLAEAAAVWAHAPPLAVPPPSEGWMASAPEARPPAHPSVVWMGYVPVAPTEGLLDDYMPTPRDADVDGEAAADMEGPPEPAADANCSLDLPHVYGEEQDPVVTAGTCLWQEHEGGNDEDEGWASSGAKEYSEEMSLAINEQVQGRVHPDGKPVDVKSALAYSPGFCSVDATLKHLQEVAAFEATNRYEQGPGRRVPPTPQPSEVEVALGDRRRSVLARKALKKRSAYTSRFKRVVYEELLEAELVARQARHDAVFAELNALRASVEELRAATAAAEEHAAVQTTTCVTPSASVAPTSAEPSPVGSPVTPTEPAVEALAASVAGPTAASAPSQPPLTWPTGEKEGPGRWTLDASWADVPFPFLEDTCAANAA